jgi:hypothetical protein
MNTTTPFLRSYTLTAGNLNKRPGHRHDCAEVKLTWTIMATSEEDAIKRSHETLRRSGWVSLPMLRIELGDLSTKLNVEEK